jgi:hypothetical protein
LKPTYRCVSYILAIDSKELRNFISPSSDDQIALKMHIACTGDIHRAKKVERDLRRWGRMSSSKDDVTICISIFYPVLQGKGGETGNFFRLFYTNLNSMKTTFCLFFIFFNADPWERLIFFSCFRGKGDIYTWLC